ncbi:glycosyltransferase family 39 protein [Microcoleus sp. D2_18a_D3]|uniref:glycosyltransferase family 39 protein n=1 Tax=Microcoleus sp. D2_18a_D3 TaxID=3055330 RepID=UPI002FD7798E
MNLFLWKKLQKLLHYFFILLLCYFCFQPAVFATTANSTPQALVSQEISYSLPENHHPVAVQGEVAQIDARTNTKRWILRLDNTSRKTFMLLLSGSVIIFYIGLLVALLKLNTEELSTRGNFFLGIFNTIIKYRFSISLGWFVVACYFVFLMSLGVPSVQMWDESRLAVNALEMALNGNLIVTHFDGSPDMWNTKPPLLIWMIALCMKIVGYNELALRLPSALSAMSTAILIFIFATKYLKDIKISLVSGLVLITSSGFIGYHTGRSGDYEALLVLWITISSLSYFIYLHSNEQKKQNFYWSIATVAIILAVLTKGIAGILPLPGILLYTAYQKKMGKLLFSSRFYISLILFSGVVLSYYFLREHYNPGYISAVFKHEVGGRYLEVHENHSAPFWYYIHNLIKYRFIPWIYVFPVGLLISIFSVKKNLKNIGIFGFFYLIGYLLIISFAKTKLDWYDNPLYPIAALVIGVGISEIFNGLNNYFSINALKRQLIFALTVISIFSIPYFNTTYNLVYKQEILSFDQYNPRIMYRDYFQEVFKDMPQLNNFTAVSNNYNAHLVFYSKLANITTKKYSILYLVEYGRQNKNHKFSPPEVIVTCEAKVTQKLAQRYKLKLLHSNDFCSTFVIEK